jgi:hypothetical protein
VGGCSERRSSGAAVESDENRTTIRRCSAQLRCADTAPIKCDVPIPLSQREAIVRSLPADDNMHTQTGKTMARKKKRVVVKSRRSKGSPKPRKKTISRATSRKKKAVTKKRAVKKAIRKRVSQPPKARQQSRRPAPIVEDTIVDVIDEPLPGVMRVTEIEEVRVAVPDEGTEEDDKE